MTTSADRLWRKLGAIICLVEQSPEGTLGRTAIVKLLYFLQELRGVPLGYDFRLYTYGPFDADILSDLKTAQSFQALQVRTVIYSSGYGYDVRIGSKAESVKERAADWLAEYQPHFDWAVEKFAARTASELELLATIAYVDRELAEHGEPRQLENLAQRVRDVKPRFTESYVLEKCREARQMGLLSAVA